jgi:hypothetical protein
MNDQQWHYEYKGNRIGPVSSDLIIEYIKDKALDGESLIWCDNFVDWQTINSTDFKIYLQINNPPPLSYDLVNNKFAWLIAFVPIIGYIIDFYIISNFSNSSIKLYDKYIFILYFLIYTYLSWIDSVQLQNAGYDSNKFKGFIWLVPVYLYQRESALKSKNKIIFLTWVSTFSIIMLLSISGENIFSIAKKVSNVLDVNPSITETIKSNNTEVGKSNNAEVVSKQNLGGLDIELNNVKFNFSQETCQFFFTITNNTDYNITGLNLSGYLKDNTDAIINQVIQSNVIGRLKKNEENTMSFVLFGCKQNDINDLRSISLNFDLVQINGEVYFNNFESVIEGKRTSRIPNIKHI